MPAATERPPELVPANAAASANAAKAGTGALHPRWTRWPTRFSCRAPSSRRASSAFASHPPPTAIRFAKRCPSRVKLRSCWTNVTREMRLRVPDEPRLDALVVGPVLAIVVEGYGEGVIGPAGQLAGEEFRSELQVARHAVLVLREGLLLSVSPDLVRVEGALAAGCVDGGDEMVAVARVHARLPSPGDLHVPQLAPGQVTGPADGCCRDVHCAAPPEARQHGIPVLQGEA